MFGEDTQVHERGMLQLLHCHYTNDCEGKSAGILKEHTKVNDDYSSFSLVLVQRIALGLLPEIRVL